MLTSTLNSSVRSLTIPCVWRSPDCAEHAPARGIESKVTEYCAARSQGRAVNPGTFSEQSAQNLATFAPSYGTPASAQKSKSVVRRVPLLACPAVLHGRVPLSAVSTPIAKALRPNSRPSFPLRRRAEMNANWPSIARPHRPAVRQITALSRRDSCKIVSFAPLAWDPYVPWKL